MNNSTFDINIQNEVSVVNNNNEKQKNKRRSGVDLLEQWYSSEISDIKKREKDSLLKLCRIKDVTQLPFININHKNYILIFSNIAIVGFDKCLPKRSKIID